MMELEKSTALMARHIDARHLLRLTDVMGRVWLKGGVEHSFSMAMLWIQWK